MFTCPQQHPAGRAGIQGSTRRQANLPGQALLAWLLLLLLVLPTSALAAPLGDAFTYQGRLEFQGEPANGEFDFRFGLAEAAVGGNVLLTQDVAAVTVEDGVFTVVLDFGLKPFAGQGLWLAISVRESGELTYTDLAPRQPLHPTPFALYAKRVADDAIGSDAIDPAEVQLRVAGSCAPGSAIRVIAQNGSVTCEADDDGPWNITDPLRIWTAADFTGVNTASPEAVLHVRDADGTRPAILVEGAGSTEGDLTWPAGEVLQLGTWDEGTTTFDRSVQIFSDGNVALDQTLTFDDVTGDKISLFGDRIGAANMYGFGVSASTLHYKSAVSHKWFVNANSNGTPIMAMDSSGLGIGTDNPNHELVVQGDDPVLQIRDDVTDNSVNAARLELLERAGLNFNGGAYFLWNGSDNRLLIGTKNNGTDTALLVLDRSSQSVGIGTQNIDNNHRLSVNGSIRAKEIVVETGWADFVFEDSYRLRPLNEVAAFIDSHGHLPDVPSAAEVAAHGVSLGAMDATLLQKIEELTLYTLELNGRIAELEAKLAERTP